MRLWLTQSPPQYTSAPSRAVSPPSVPPTVQMQPSTVSVWWRYCLNPLKLMHSTITAIFHRRCIPLAPMTWHEAKTDCHLECNWWEHWRAKVYSVLLLNYSADCVIPKCNTEYCVSFCLQRVNNCRFGRPCLGMALKWKIWPIAEFMQKEHVLNKVLNSKEIFSTMPNFPKVSWSFLIKID